MSPARGKATTKAATPPPVAQVIAGLLKTQAGLDLPIRLRAWDGSEAGPEGTPVLIARSPQALRRILWRPGELGLARAYISGDLDTIKLIEQAGFEVIGVRAMREHYVRTIRAWLDNFEQHLDAVTGILSAEQVRLWRLYLAGGALAFEEGRMGVDQILAVKR